ncbi:MAG TPA: hypothetical protein IAB12_07010 [Candidatus Ornithospirochaeta avicola]|uniref:Uncharacterized protein n=1 Tax=Candidatus Ornithospirochaeta avicola TaxID=2840896 RepID=A0A9D1PVP7_9SPIO|nr:hypothetical protein [Candidatus Ornithospirochaeta avicola]
MGRKFLAVFLILISILSFSSCSMDSLTDFMGKMGVNIVPYDNTKAKKAAEETNLSSSDVDENATVEGGNVEIGGVKISLEDGFTLDESGGMLKPLEDSERKEVVNTLYNAVVTLNPKDKETVVAEKAKAAPQDVQQATKNTAKVLESALNKLKEGVSGEGDGDINKVEEVMGSLASSLNTIANNKTVSQGEALAVQLMQSFVVAASTAYTSDSVIEDEYINLANEAYNIAVIASAITPTLNIGLDDLIGAVVSGMGSSSSSEEETRYSSRSLMLLSAEGEDIPNYSSSDDRPSEKDFDNIGIPEESALVLRNYYKAISPFLNDPDYMNTIAVYKASFDNYMVFAEKAGEDYMASDEFKSIAEPSVFFNYALTSALYELENQYKLIRKEAESGRRLDKYIELEGSVKVDDVVYDYKFPETIVELINDFADSNQWVKDDSKLKIEEIKIGDSWQYGPNGEVINHEEIFDDLVKIKMPYSIKGIVFAFAYDSNFTGSEGEENTKNVIDVINEIVVDNNASLLAAINSAEIALTHGDLLSSIIDLVTQMAGEDTGDVETPTDSEIEKALNEARDFLKSRNWVEDYFDGGETV